MPFGIHHVVIKGNANQTIFEEPIDNSIFLKFVRYAKQKFVFELYSYVLMGNHAHLIIQADGVMLGEIMHLINTLYAQYFTKKYGYIGHVFKGRYFERPVMGMLSLIRVINYVHNNPVPALVNDVAKYEWSSYHEFIYGEKLCSTRMVLKYLGGKEKFIQEMAIPDNSEAFEGPRYRSLKDTDAIQIARDILGIESPFEIKSFEIPKRNEAIRILYSEGLPQNQICRIAGISSGIVSRAIKETCLGNV